LTAVIGSVAVFSTAVSCALRPPAVRVLADQQRGLAENVRQTRNGRSEWDLSNHRSRFRCVFNDPVGSQSHSPARFWHYKFRDRWIRVALPPPAAPAPTFSRKSRAQRSPTPAGVAPEPQDRHRRGEAGNQSLRPSFSKPQDFADLERMS